MIDYFQLMYCLILAYRNLGYSPADSQEQALWLVLAVRNNLAGVLSAKYAREWAEQFSLEIEDITLAAQREDGTWYHDPAERV